MTNGTFKDKISGWNSIIWSGESRFTFIGSGGAKKVWM